MRDVEFERAFTDSARAWVTKLGFGGFPTDNISNYAEGRALPGPVIDLASRDFTRESREELADCRNYLCWDALQLQQSGRTDEAAAEAMAWLTTAMAAVVVAFEAHTHARRVLRDNPHRP